MKHTNTSQPSLITQSNNNMSIMSIGGNNSNIVGPSVSTGGGGGIAANLGVSSLLQQLDMKQTNIPLNLPMPPIGGGKPSIMGLMPHFEDPVEQSLASLEQPTLKSDIDGISHMDLISDMSSIISKQESSSNLSGNSGGGVGGGGTGAVTAAGSILNYGNSGGIHSGHHGSNNGFSMEAAMNMNGVMMAGNGMLMGMLPHAMPQLNSMSQPTSNIMTSIFDPLPTSMHRNTMAPSSNSMPMPVTPTTHSAPSLKKEEKFMLTPKPIEELMMPSHDKKTPPLDAKGASASFVHAFNKSHDHNLKNASSWSSLAAAGSPQNTPTSSKSKPPAMDSFQQFRNKAKEKADRQKLLEQQELRRSQKEAADKRQQQEQHKHVVKPREDVEAPRFVWQIYFSIISCFSFVVYAMYFGRSFRKAPVVERVVEDIKASPQGSGSPGTPTTPSDRAAAKRAELRRLERRRREAVSIYFNVNNILVIIEFFVVRTFFLHCCKLFLQTNFCQDSILEKGRKLIRP